MKKVLMFPGQGSQITGMGKELFDRYPEIVQICNDVLDYSIVELCLEENDRLNLTQYTQVALYVVGVMEYLEYVSQSGAEDIYAVIGHSLGEYVALYASNVFDFEAGLRLVKKRGQLMSEVSEGGMSAVINSSEESIRHLIRQEPYLDLDLANINSPQQVILSGPKSVLKTVRSDVKALGARIIPLNVSAAFHSRYMMPLSEEFFNYLESVSFSRPSKNVYSNVSALKHGSDVDAIKQLLKEQLYKPVQWLNTIMQINNEGDFEFIELGPKTVLTDLVKKII